MLAAQLIHTSYPTLQLTDKVYFALQLMEDYDLLHLPIVQEEKYIGLISKEDLLDEDEQAPLAVLENKLSKAFVTKDEFFLSALKKLTEQELSLIAVINEQLQLLGLITQQTLIKQANHFLGNTEPGAIIVIEVERRNYSFGELSRLIETNDAYITQLNTSTEESTGLVLVTIKINKQEVSDIVATLQRYDYIVRYYFGVEQFANEIKENYNQLMFYLNI